LKLIKRSSGEPEQTPQEDSTQKNGGRKPVIVYIMILFIVAFILMAISFFMHQRSNSDVIGRLQNSVTALQEVQKAEDKNIQLQEQLDDANGQKETLQKELEEANSEKASATQQTAAMESLYILQQQYSAQDYSACEETITDMENRGLDKLLPAEIDDQVTSPAQRYLQLREAVRSR
jgi:uroporphyrin-3 C-methyltransferase